MTAATTYWPAPEVAATAVPLISDFHPHLADAPIVYVFRLPTLRSRDKIVLGRALRVLGLNAFLAALAAGDAAQNLNEAEQQQYGFFVMEVAFEEWQIAPESSRVGLVDHELCHFDIHHETGELKIRAHDVEEFVAVAHRHGARYPETRALVEVCSVSR